MKRQIDIMSLINHEKLIIIGKHVQLNGLNLCNRDTNYTSIISYVTNENYIEDINRNKSITFLILSKELLELYQKKIERDMTYVLSEYPEITFYKMHEYLIRNTDFYDTYEFETSIGENCNIHNSTIIEKGVMIGNNVRIGARSVIRRGTVIEDNVSIGCGSIIGSEGFQIISNGDVRIKVEHVGGTFIGKNVSVGDNCTICNSLFEGQTRIEKNAKIDNLVHVAHNCLIEENAVLTAGVILCGSCIIGNSAWIGVNASILNGVRIGSRAKVGIGSIVNKSIPNDSVVGGLSAKLIRID